MLFCVLTLVCCAGLIVVFSLILKKIVTTTSSPTATSSTTLTPCQTCLKNCGSPPQYPNTQTDECSAYNTCLEKCALSNRDSPCDPANTIECGCPNGCQPYFNYVDGQQTFFPGVCMYGEQDNGSICPPYPDIYTLQCNLNNTSTSLEPGICGCFDGNYLFGPIVTAKSGINPDCNAYPNTQAICGCFDRNIDMSTGLEFTKNT